MSRRPATAADKSLAMMVHHLAYREVVERQFGRWDEAEQDAYFDATWPKHAHEMLTWDEEVCGYVAVETGAGGVVIHELVIHPEYQNRGIGTGIVREALATARNLGLPVQLRVLHANRARQLYERLGFEEYGRTATHRLMYLRPSGAS